MYQHANAKLGLAGRLALVRAIDDGLSLKAAAAAFSVSPATAHRWWHRWLEGKRRPDSLLDRSSRPHRSPRLLARDLQERICDCRPTTGWGPRLVAAATGFAHSTCGRCCVAMGCRGGRRRSRSLPTTTSGLARVMLLHMDVCSYARFLRPSHGVTGDRSQRRRGRSVETRVGYDQAHANVDDHSRLGYVELHDDDKADGKRLRRTRACLFAKHGILAKRLMTDNSFAYVKNRSLRELLAERGIRQLTTEPYRPRTNGKVERFHQAMAREWAYGLSSAPHRQRSQVPPHWLDHYNTRRPHSSLGDQPPISRVHNVHR
jgi:transposase InsO family protein